MSNKPNLEPRLSETGGSARAGKPVIQQSATANERAVVAAPAPKGRTGPSPITVHFPKQMRDQLKILAVQNGTTLHGLVADPYNDLFAKYGKPEIVSLREE